jgi:hypothetical protein
VKLKISIMVLGLLSGGLISFVCMWSLFSDRIFGTDFIKSTRTDATIIICSSAILLITGLVSLIFVILSKDEKSKNETSSAA